MRGRFFWVLTNSSQSSELRCTEEDETEDGGGGGLGAQVKYSCIEGLKNPPQLLVVNGHSVFENLIYDK